MQITQAEFSSNGSGYALPEYPFVAPPELQSKTRGKSPIVVVGGGLGGLTLACDLAVRGVPCVLLDEDNTVGVKGASSRGICYAQKSLEVFERLGIYQRILAKGVQWQVGRTLAGDEEVYSFDLRQNANQNLSEQPPFINLQQFYLEWFLVDRIAEINAVKPVCDLRWQSRVINVTQDNTGALLTVQTPQGEYELQADWLIDASGLHSFIRNSYGLNINAARGEDRWCISDVKFKTQPPTERWTWIEAPFNENRAVWQHLMADQVWRLDYQMAPNCDMDFVSRADVVAERLQRQFGEGVDFDIVWVGPYGYRSHCLDFFRHGRTLFVGDVAHVMSPFGARGGNSAIQDADNLGWKLAWWHKGWANEALLESYHVERHFAAQDNIRTTARTMRFLAASEPAEKLFRQAVLDLARKHKFAQSLVNTGRMSQATVYPKTTLEKAGVPLQNAYLSDKQSLAAALKLAAGKALLLTWHADLDAAIGIESAVIKLGLPVQILALGKGAAAFITPLLGDASSGVILVRPDGYCGGVSSLSGAADLLAHFKKGLQ